MIRAVLLLFAIIGPICLVTSVIAHLLSLPDWFALVASLLIGAPIGWYFPDIMDRLGWWD